MKSITDFINKVHQGNNLDILKEMPDDSVDCMVTDPNYGIHFMNKKWDIDVPSIEQWKECLRVLKNGAFAFVMSSPRQDVLSQMIMRIGDAGFNTGFTSIYHTYASGFPKSMNISKSIDKKFGLERTIIGSTIGKGGENLNQLSRINGNDSEDAKSCGAYGTGAKKRNIKIPVTIPTSTEAKSLDGSYAGFQPKPAVEVIIVVMKPLSEKTYMNQALKNSHGVTWLDNCRIPYQLDDDKWEYPEGAGGVYSHDYQKNDICKDWHNFSTIEDNKPVFANNKGRFPANLLVSDDILSDGKKHTAGDLTGQHGTVGNIYGVYNRNKELYLKGNPVDSYSRYFDIDAWFEEVFKKLPPEVQRVFPFLIIPKVSKSERNRGCGDIKKEVGHNRFDKCQVCGGTILQNPTRPSACKCEDPSRMNNIIEGNTHVAVKPLKLFSYLITLGSRMNDIILDPFAGSGTLGVACHLLNRNFVCIEIESDYVEIVNNRIEQIQSDKPHVRPVSRSMIL